MELSLMYDVLYTKSAKIHSWGGYLIRVVSPIATVTMTLLFLFYDKAGQRTADVIITYILLVVTFLLDVRWAQSYSFDLDIRIPQRVLASA